MSTYDTQQGKMILIHFQPKVQHPQSAADYIRRNFEVLARNIHPLDQIELHKQTGDMVHSTLINKAMEAHETRDSLGNITSQLQIEKASS